MKKRLNRLFRKRTKVNLSLTFRANENINETLKKVEMITKQHPEMDFNIKIHW